MSSEYQRQRVASWLRRWAGRCSRVAVVYDNETAAEVLMADAEGRRIGDSEAADALCDAAEDIASAAGRAVTVSIRALSDTAGAGPIAQMPYRAMVQNTSQDSGTIAQLLAQNHAFARANLELLQQQQQGFNTLLDSMTRLMEAATRRAEAEASRADAATAQAREAVELAEEVQAAAARAKGSNTREQLGAAVVRLLEPRIGALVDAAAGSLLTPGDGASGEPS